VATDRFLHLRRPKPRLTILTLAAAAILLGRVGQVGGRWWATALVVVGLVAWIAALVDLGRSLHGRSADDADVSSATVSATLCAAVAPLVTVPAVALIARQYVERAARPSGTDSYIGPLFPVLLWSALVVASLATVAGTWVIGPLLRRRITRVSMLRPQLFMAGVVGASFLLRVAALLRIAPARTDGGDPLYYHTQANTLANGLGFVEPLNWIASGTRIPTAVHGPGYTIYLAVFSRLGASTWFDHRMASSLIGAGSVLLAILLAKRLGGSLAAVLAGVFAAMYPNMWTIDGVLFPEGLFIFCCGLTMVFAYRWRDHHRVSDAIGLGAAIGAAALTRGEGIFLTVLLAAPLMLLARTLTRRVRFTALAWVFVATLAVVAPWTLRNMVVFEKFVPLSTNGNELHVYSNCTDTYEGKFLGFWLFDCQQRLRDPDGDGCQLRAARRRGGEGCVLAGGRIHARPREHRTAAEGVGRSGGPAVGSVPPLPERQLCRDRRSQPRLGQGGAGLLLRARRGKRRRGPPPSPIGGDAAATGRPVRCRHHHRRLRVRNHTVPCASGTRTVRTRRRRCVPARSSRTQVPWRSTLADRRTARRSTAA
jgi:hypothetical protein